MSIDRKVDKEVVVHVHSGIFLSSERNTFESALMRWMNLEPIIQSEVSHTKERQISYSNAYMWTLEKWS